MHTYTPSTLITGSNRGLGLQWVRHYASRGWRVYATCRFPQDADRLNQLTAEFDNLSVHRLDITRPDEIQATVSALRDTPLDLLINNAGVYFERWGKDRLGAIDYSDWGHTFEVNTLGAIRMSEALAENLARSHHRLIATTSSHMGSINDITSPNDYAYRSSKAALNAAMKGLSHELALRGIGVLLLHPGWVKTRMGGDSAPIETTESIEGMSRLIDEFELSQSGKFYRYDGSEIPW